MRFIGINPEDDRYRLQALRASPPARAERGGARRQVFGAALEQWDSLIVASADVPPATSPILLFYALAQASQAIGAARIAGQPWRPHGHGLTIGDPQPIIGETQITPTKSAGSAFSLLCKALGEGGLREPVTLGALWASIPHLQPAATLDGDHPRALNVSVRDASNGEPVEVTFSGAIAADLPTDPEACAAELARRLTGYPAAVSKFRVVRPPSSGYTRKPSVAINWVDQDGAALPAADILWGLAGPTSSGSFVYPYLNAAGDRLHPLALWWAMLLALSSVARYHPDSWRDVLARDRSPAAVPIEEALSLGRELLPWMVLHALSPDTTR